MASRLQFEAIGSSWKINIEEALSPSMEVALLFDIQTYCEEFDRNYSRFRDDSLVSLMAKETGEYDLPEDAKPMLDMYEKMYKLTNGAFTPLIGSVLVEAGYDAVYSLIPKEISKPYTWEEVIEYNFPKLNLKKPALLDFGAIGKGYLIDQLAKIIDSHSVLLYTIDAGGDIYHKGNGTVVGLEHPTNLDEIIGTVSISNESICGSSGNRRAWDRFHHIIDPNTLESPRHILSTWAIASSTLLADTLATSLFLTDKEILKSEFDFQYVIIYSDNTVEVSDNFKGELYS